MIVLGIDPGIERTGFAIIQEQNGDAKLLACGCINTPKGEPLPKRLVEIKNDLYQLIKKWKPEVLVIESLFFASNAKTALIVGQARGVVLLTCQESDLEIIEVTPLQVKMSATGYGKADKKQVQEMVVKIFKLKKIPKPDDAVDAAAIAWAGLGRIKFSRL